MYGIMYSEIEKDNSIQNKVSSLKRRCFYDKH